MNSMQQMISHLNVEFAWKTSPVCCSETHTGHVPISLDPGAV